MHLFICDVTDPQNQVKSRKILNHWREAAGMSKIGNRTKNLLGKWQKTQSQSVDQSLTNSPGASAPSRSVLIKGHYN